MTFLVTGAGGQLGSVLLRQLHRAGRPALGVASPAGPLPDEGDTVRADLTDAEALGAIFERARPTHVVHAGAVSSVAAAHADPARALRVNAEATAVLVALARRAGARFVHVSTDMVFDGEHAPYAEGAVPSPLSTYGHSKLSGEHAALAVTGTAVVRLPLLYGLPAVGRETTFVAMVRALRASEPLTLFEDEFRAPLALEDAAMALVEVTTSSFAGILHVGGPERLSRLAMGRHLAEALGAPEALLRAVRRGDVAAPEPRARDLCLDSSAYRAAFGRTPGRPMREALRGLLAG